MAASFLNDITRALASDQLDGRWAMFWGDEQRGIGELMTEQPPGVSVIVCGHAAFFRNYDQTYPDWIDRFADDLFTPANVEDSDRLRLLQWASYGSYGSWTSKAPTTAIGSNAVRTRSAGRHRRGARPHTSKT